MRITSAGRVGIHTTNPQTDLEVNGTISASNVYVTATTGTVSGTYVYAQYISGSQISGKFIGDGSGLTGVVASTADRIVSGTTSMLAVSATGFISVTQSGTNTAWFDPTRGLVTIGISSTGTISTTNLYASGNVGIGTTNPLYKLVVGATSQYVVVPDYGGNGDIGSGSTLFGSKGGDLAFFPDIGNVAAGKRLMFTYYASDYGVRSAIEVANVTSGFGTLSMMKGGGNIGIGTVTPSATLHVSGTIKLAGTGSDPCAGANNYGTLRINPATGKLQLCRQ
jgi:hypothetical protein